MARVRFFVGADIGEAEKAFKRLSRKMKKFGRQAEATGRVLTKTFTVPIAAVGAASVKAGIDFESAFAGVRKTVKGTEAEFTKLSRGIRDMSMQMPASASSIAKVAESAGQLGIEQENILGFADTIIKLSDATNLASEEGAMALAKFANVTGMSQKYFDRLGSTIVDLGNNLATTEADIVDMGSRLAGAGKQINLTQAQIMGLAAGLSSVGLNAEAGGTAFSKVMSKMQLAIETNNEQLTQFANIAGMTSDEFKQAFKVDAAGAIIDFLEGLSKTEEQGVSTIKVLEDMGITEVRLRDALLRASSASDVMRKAVDLGTQAWGENVALTKEAEERYKTTASKLKILRNNITDMFIDLSDPILDLVHKDLPALQGRVDKISKAFKSMSTESKNNLMKVVAVLAVGGPLMLAVNASIGVISTLGTALLSLASGPLAPIVMTTTAVYGLVEAFNTLKDQASLGFRAADDVLERGAFMVQAGEVFEQRKGRKPRTYMAADIKEIDKIIDELIKQRSEAIAREAIDVEAPLVVPDEEEPTLKLPPRVTPKIPKIPGAGAAAAYIGMTTAESTAADIARMEAARDAQLDAVEAARRGVEKFWSEMAWEAGQGLITNTEYFDMLKTDIGELTQGSDEWRQRFSELQAVAGSLAGEQLSGLREAIDNGEITTEEWTLQIEELKQKFADLPIVQKKLNDALKNSNSNVGELNTSSALWANTLSQGLANAIVNAESLGDALQNIGKQLASSMIQKFILGSITGEDTGPLGKLLGMHTGGVVGQDHSLVRNIPKMHNGGIVGADEQMTILQKGETVLPRGEGAGSQTTINISAVDARSFQQMLESGKATIESVVVRSIAGNGAVRKAVRGYV